MSDDRLRLAAKRQLARRLERETVVREGPSGLGHENDPGGGGREEARRRVHGVARHGVRGARGPAEIPGYHGTGVDSHVERDGLAEAPRPLVAQRRAALEHVQRRVAGAGRIVLVRDRRAEDRQHGIAHELLDEAVIARDRPGQRFEQRALERAHVFGIEPLGERREPGEIREQHRHLAAVGLSTGAVWSR